MTENPYREAPPPPERPPSPVVPVWLVLFLCFGFAVMTLVAGFFFFEIRALKRVKPPEFLGEEHLQPVQDLASGWKRYKIPSFGAELDLPANPVAAKFDYSAMEGRQTSGYVHYDHEDFRISAYRYRSHESRSYEEMAELIANHYEVDPRFSDLKFRVKPIEVDGRKGAQARAAGLVDGEGIVINIVMFAPAGMDFLVETFGETPEKSDPLIARIRDSIRLNPVPR